MRQDVQMALAKAATALGHSAHHYGSHSLRFGGASAIWAAYRDSGLVRRWGRWASDSYQTYLWDDRNAAKGVASAMSTTDLTPV